MNGLFSIAALAGLYGSDLLRPVVSCVACCEIACTLCVFCTTCMQTVIVDRYLYDIFV